MLQGYCGLYIECRQSNKIRLNEKSMRTTLQERYMRPLNLAINGKVKRRKEMLAGYRFAMQLCGSSSLSCDGPWL
jgi:hypothetical protein